MRRQVRGQIMRRQVRGQIMRLKVCGQIDGSAAVKWNRSGKEDDDINCEEHRWCRSRSSRTARLATAARCWQWDLLQLLLEQDPLTL